jgi:hypothetical protein
MLDRSDYELVAKYDSADPEFDADELATVFEILNLEPTTFVRVRFSALQGPYFLDAARTK